MINTENVFGDATDFDRSLFASSLEKYLSDLPRYVENVSRRVKEREMIATIKEKLSANAQNFVQDELELFLSALRFYRDNLETYANLDASAEEKIQVSARKYIRRLDDLLSDLQK